GCLSQRVNAYCGRLWSRGRPGVPGEAARQGLDIGGVVAQQLHAHGGPGAVVQLEQGLLADDDRCGQLDERLAWRRRVLGSPLDPFLQAVVIETECGGSATEAMLADQPDGQGPQGLRNAAAPLPSLPPGLKPAAGLRQILRQLAPLMCTHRGPPKRGPAL